MVTLFANIIVGPITVYCSSSISLPSCECSGARRFEQKKTFDVTVVGVCLQKYMSFLLHCASTVIYITMIKKHSVYRKNLKSDNVVRTTWCNFFVFRVQTYRLTHFASHTFCEVSVQRLIISNSRLVSSFLFIHLFITHAGFIAAGVGRTFSRVCLSACLFVRALKGKRLELSTLRLVRIYCISQSLGMHWPRCQKVKGQGHTVTKTVTVARLLVTRAATAVCCCCLHAVGLYQRGYGSLDTAPQTLRFRPEVDI